MATDTVTSPLPRFTQTSIRLRGRVRLAANILWYALFAAWLAYLVVGWRFSATRAETNICGVFAEAIPAGSMPTCVTIASVAEWLGQIVFMVAAVLLFLRKPNEVMTVLASAVLLILSAGISNVSLSLSSYPETIPISRFMLGFSLWATGVFLLLFPDGRLQLRWTWLIAVLHGLWVLSWWVIPAMDITRGLSLPSYPLLALSMIPATGALWMGYRRTFTPTQQQQTKWVIFGVVGAVIIYLVFVMTALTARALLENSPTGLAIYVASVYGRWLALMLVPVTILFSIARYRLWDVDLVINRALATGAVSLVLAVVFIGAVLAVQRLAVALTGGEQAGAAVVVASLAVMLLFNPVRTRLTAVVEYLFYPRSLQATQRGVIEIAPVLREGEARKAFGRYEIQELIGRGGMSEVYKARQIALDRIVAVKVLTSTLAQDARFRARFNREAHMVGEMHHPNIVSVYDAGEEKGIFYIAMEYIPGETLSSCLKREGKLPFPDAASIVRDIASALDYAHERGIVHRDIKPHNIMLQKVEAPMPDEPSFRPVLMDFGIARMIAAHTALSSGSSALGTLDYVSPEQILESSRVDRRADVYSLGIVAFQMFTGKLPFADKSPAAVIMNHLKKPAPDPRTANPDVPLHVAFAILRAMSKDPDERPQTAGEFATLLS